MPPGMTLNPKGMDIIMTEATLSSWQASRTMSAGGGDEDLEEDLDEDLEEDDDLEDEDDLEDDDEDKDDEEDDIEAMTRVR